MALYSFLTQKLRKFTVVEFGMVKWIYLTLGVVLAAVYAPLSQLPAWNYLVLSVLAGLPLVVLAFSFPGSIWAKAEQYLSNNTPAHQVLTLICCASLGMALALFFPVIASADGWVYAAIIAVLFVKPFHHLFLSK